MDALPAARTSSPWIPPLRVGRYDLFAELGRGGMSRVFLARGLGRLTAVKLPHRGLCTDDDFAEMFLDEARVAARLHHPNVTALIEAGADGPQLFMAMDYIEGDTLHAVQCAAIRLRRSVPLGIALRIALDALAGLDAAHELRDAAGASLGLIHRDVTPHNVLVGVDGVARLVDFGIARAAGRAGVTGAGILKGKLPFMAPEQIAGRPVDRRADLFSMGVMLWETFALRRCFPPHDGILQTRLVDAPYRPLRHFAPHVPAALDDLCRRALAFEPADRYATAAQFAEAIERAFRADLATSRELGHFMSVVAADKVRVEREATRRSARPMPPPRLELARRTSRGEDLDDDVTTVLDSALPRPLLGKPVRLAAPPPVPAWMRRTLPRPVTVVPPENSDAALFLAGHTEAFALQRPRLARAPSPTAPTLTAGTDRSPVPASDGPISGVRPTTSAAPSLLRALARLGAAAARIWNRWRSP